MTSPVTVHLDETRTAVRIGFADPVDVAKYTDSYPPTLVAPETVERWKEALEQYDAVQEEMRAAYDATWRHVQVIEDMEAEEEHARWAEEDAVRAAETAAREAYLDRVQGPKEWVIVDRVQEGESRTFSRHVGHWVTATTLHHKDCFILDRVSRPSTIAEATRIADMPKPGEYANTGHTRGKPVKVCGHCRSKYLTAVDAWMVKGVTA